ncbi:hypothetical protein J4208_02625 [Candidatus Woesearchaeota archaeon]|nr:hypothetical protein [Candidatus Woesearchaeota archaeon]
MADDQKKRNTYAILFFLAILFVAIGFERGGAISGEYTRIQPSAAFPETWSLSCNKPSVQAAGQDLGRSLHRAYGCQKGQTQIYCKQAVAGLSLPKNTNVRVSCTSAIDKNNFVKFCEQQVLTLCTPSSRTVRTFIRK